MAGQRGRLYPALTVIAQLDKLDDWEAKPRGAAQGLHEAPIRGAYRFQNEAKHLLMA